MKNGDDYDKSKIGLIQTPQSSYNADIFHLTCFQNQPTNEQDFFSKEINVSNTCTVQRFIQSNTLIFRKAIEDVGGFPTDTITEDFELGVWTRLVM